ncbi:MAG: hypothetical protein ABSA72_10550 [Nitrososphaerales archaeon]|jgi:hypothetical protein
MTQIKDHPGAPTKGEPAAPLRCYSHPAHRATGVCSICKLGVCSSCQVIFKGRRFCRDDAALLRKQQVDTAKARRRKIAIEASGVLALLDGMAGAVVGFLLIIIGLIGPQAQSSYSLTNTLQPFFTYFANVLTFPSSQALEVGLFIFGLGLLDMFAGVGMVKRSRLAGVLSIGISILGGVAVGSYLVILALAGFFTYVYLVSAVVKIGLIGFGRKHLDER